MQADVKRDIYEGLLAKSAAESPKGAGQYFTPRQLIQAIVDCVQLSPDDTVCDPACGTGGFLLAAHDYVIRHHGKELDPDEKKHLRRSFVHGWELVPNTGAAWSASHESTTSVFPSMPFRDSGGRTPAGTLRPVMQLLPRLQ